MFETGQIEHLLAAIDNIVNGEVNLPPGEQIKLFQRIRQVGKGYTVISTNYSYNARNQLVHRENQIRYEDYDYSYDESGNLLTDGRSKYEWNALGQLTKVTFPDGFGEKYTYDMLGRRISKTDFNHIGETQETTNYTYKGDTWAITEERDGSGQVTKSYTYDANDRPLTITMEGQTFWYVYNGHGDVTALTDKDGKVAARYEYDAWGLVTRMYNGLGERVREGIGWIGDLGTGNGSPGSVQGPEDESGNTEPDYHPGNGNNNGNGNGKVAAKKDKAVQKEASAQAVTEATDSEQADTAAGTVSVDLSAELSTVETEPTDDITTDLVKENPYRYAGYYWDRKTQYYYLQARYYDPRLARFISEDTYEGEIENPQSLNQYVYVENNPLKYIDPTGHKPLEDKDTQSKTNDYAIVRVTTFIPYKTIPENLGTGLGDNRSLWQKGSHRSQHTVVVNLDTGKIASESKDASRSIIQLPLGKQLVSDIPSTKGLKTESSLKKGVVTIKMKGKIASDDLKWIPGMNISYHFTITLNTNSNSVIPKLVGKHDGFPAYEVLVVHDNIWYGYGYDPRQTGHNYFTKDNIFSLFGSEERKVDRTMVCIPQY